MKRNQARQKARRRGPPDRGLSTALFFVKVKARHFGPLWEEFCVCNPTTENYNPPSILTTYYKASCLFSVTIEASDGNSATLL